MTANAPRFSMVIEWSDEDGAYVVSFPEWEAAGHLARTHGDTCAEAARTGADMLDFLIWSAHQDGSPLPLPRQFDFDARHRAESSTASGTSTSA
ncbi:MAG: type II toxin-antitoxin system HicB family antitoxin [Ktedonobacterales bacterium]